MMETKEVDNRVWEKRRGKWISGESILENGKVIGQKTVYRTLDHPSMCDPKLSFWQRLSRRFSKLPSA
jgi:hypothetical protein